MPKDPADDLAAHGGPGGKGHEEDLDLTSMQVGGVVSGLKCLLLAFMASWVLPWQVLRLWHGRGGRHEVRLHHEVAPCSG